MTLISNIVTALEKRDILIARSKFKYQPAFTNLIYKNLLARSSGVIHIGAHTGQEADVYGQLGLDVIWFEGDSLIFPRLESNIKEYPKQRALNVLLGDTDDQEVNFYRSSNDGQGSSLFKFGKESFEGVKTVETEKLITRRLDSIISSERAKNFDHWAIDVQGAELIVLRGAGDLLKSCKWMLIEVSLRETYSGGARFDELCDYLSNYQLIPLWEPPVGFHGDVIFVKLNS